MFAPRIWFSCPPGVHPAAGPDVQATRLNSHGEIDNHVDDHDRPATGPGEIAGVAAAVV
jgi:hypothetical protein